MSQCPQLGARIVSKPTPQWILLSYAWRESDDNGVDRLEESSRMF